MFAANCELVVVARPSLKLPIVGSGASDNDNKPTTRCDRLTCDYEASSE